MRHHQEYKDMQSESPEKRERERGIKYIWRNDGWKPIAGWKTLPKHLSSSKLYIVTLLI